MREFLDSPGLRVLAYALVAGLAVVAGLRERREVHDQGIDRWPTFWFLSAALLLVMGLARAADIDDVLTAFGRDNAVSGGWYENRRPLQAAAVAVVGSIWAIGVVVAIWRVPERRRRYLPAAVMLLTVVCYAGVRLISLHHVDALLYNRGLAGVRFVSVFELSLLALTALTMFWFPFVPSRLRRPAAVT